MYLPTEGAPAKIVRIGSSSALSTSNSSATPSYWTVLPLSQPITNATLGLAFKFLYFLDVMKLLQIISKSLVTPMPITAASGNAFPVTVAMTAILCAAIKLRKNSSCLLLEDLLTVEIFITQLYLQPSQK